MKTIYFVIFCILSIILCCKPNKEEPPVPLHTVVDGYVRDSSNNNPIIKLEIHLSKQKKYGYPDGDAILFRCNTDSNGYYKIDENIIPEKDYTYTIGTYGNELYHRGSVQPSGYYEITPGQNKTINIYLLRTGK